MAKKPIWLSEMEICDLMEQRPDFLCDEYLPYNTRKAFREFKIGRGRIDFVEFTTCTATRPGIELIEVKITATIDSLNQLVKYRQDMNSYLFRHFMGSGATVDEIPHLYCNLAARYFDSQIIELAHELGITLWRIDVLSKTEIKIDLYEYGYPDREVPEDPALHAAIDAFFGGSRG